MKSIQRKKIELLLVNKAEGLLILAVLHINWYQSKILSMFGLNSYELWIQTNPPKKSGNISLQTVFVQTQLQADHFHNAYLLIAVQMN